MKNKLMLAIGSAFLVGAVAAQAAGSASLDVASSYVFRGATLNDSFVAQPGMEVSGHGLTFGAWANFDLDDDEANGIESGNFSEIDLYLSYDIPIESDDFGLSVGYTEYTYPHASGTVGADGMTVDPVEADREIGVVGSVNTVASPSLGVYYGFDGGIDETLYLELGAEHSVDLEEGLSATAGAVLGYLDPDQGDSGFSHLMLSAGLGFGMFSAGVDWIIETDDDVLMVDEEFVGKVGFSHDF